jgi:hypothetical protein
MVLTPNKVTVKLYAALQPRSACMRQDHSADPCIGGVLNEIATQFGIELKRTQLSREFRWQKEFAVICGQTSGCRG